MAHEKGSPKLAGSSRYVTHRLTGERFAIETFIAGWLPAAHHAPGLRG